MGRCRVMGIVNVTPDSFSDGGKFSTPEEAIRRARNLVQDGADIIDIGGESTRPGASPIDWECEWSRIGGVVGALCRESGGVCVSVDTYHPETAKRAIEAGAKMINCVYPEPVPELAALCAESNTELVIPSSALHAIHSSLSLYLDPMVGFGTTREEDLALIKSIPELAKKGKVLVGASRKRIVKHLTGERMTGRNLGGNIGVAVWCAMAGASIVRVHDVFETVQALKVVEALNAQ